MTKYSFQHRPGSDGAFTAASKPINDVCAILSKLGFVIIFMTAVTKKNKIGRLSNRLYQLGILLKLRVKLKPHDIVMIQYPLNFIYLKEFYQVLGKTGVTVYVLVHDIGLRYAQEKDWVKNFPPNASLIIVHSEEMRQVFIAEGFDSSKMKILTSFDYLTTDEITRTRRKTKEVVFAGNLEKSQFLKKFLWQNGLTINCYGKRIEKLSPGLTYKGAFTPEHVSVLEGSWGLVWDGDSVDTCAGLLGEYLRFNAPHKLSLYIVAHLPVIVWDQAAMASYVKERGIGICVSSLKDISERIDSMTDEEYDKMLDNVKKESALLRSGEHLRRCLV